jgi:hypothetical protein
VDGIAIVDPVRIPAAAVFGKLQLGSVLDGPRLADPQLVTRSAVGARNLAARVLLPFGEQRVYFRSVGRAEYAALGPV